MTEMDMGGGFADLGLENPGSYELPNYGIEPGTYRAFVKDVKFVANKKDTNKKNLVITYEVNEPGNKMFGKTIDEYKACNSFDDAKTKGYLVDRMESLGIPASELPKTNPRSLVGTPIYLTVSPQRDNPRYSQVGRVTLDTDSEHVNVVQPPVGSSAPAAVSAGSIDY